MKDKFIIIFVTTATAEEAEKISRILVEEKLAACGTIMAGLRSIYFWEGKIEDAKESMMVIKTKTSRFKKIEKRVRSLHSYSVPEIVAVPVVQGSKTYLKWVKENSKG